MILWLDPNTLIYIPYARVDCLKAIPFTSAHTFIAYIWQYLLPPPSPGFSLFRVENIPWSICVYVYMCICVYVYMCICVYVYMCICVYVWSICVLLTYYTSELILWFHYLCSQCYAAQHSFVPILYQICQASKILK